MEIGVGRGELTLRLWTTYWLGVKARMRGVVEAGFFTRSLLGMILHPAKFVHVFTPIDYVRYREFEFAFESIGKYVTVMRKVLDIGSPKLLGLSLAVNMPGVVVHTIDIIPAEAAQTLENAGRLRSRNLIPGVQDARCLGYADNSFDFIVSISVFEHIAPERDGEVPAAREMGRVLAPQGIAVLTVPFSRTYFAEYRVGQVYERASSDEEPIFFQRFYDYDLLIDNIVHASGLDLLYLGFIEERFFSGNPRKRMAHYVNSSPRQNTLFGLTFPILSRVFLSAPKPLEFCKKPYLACLVLKKN